ncbi:MAG: LLM class F420-dependent oxidoreductase [Chloroflexaceae bacterium]|nr:LLM class F420-dependent oxidoreductase [Chloroflexaceae bacterium]NJO04864.1 LLM class F420-dependent oxidoreductase [Chloroflexaceae bacterium]
MARIRVGVQIHPQHTTYQSFMDAVQRAEEIGVDTIWNWDHFFPLYPPINDDNPHKENHFEGWTLLAAMAAKTTRAEVGCLVTCNSYRNPALLAVMAKTVDHISNGRLILGIGAGWFERDYTEYGYEFGTAPDRLRALRDALPLIKDHLEGDIPAPIRTPIPICIGGGGEKVTLKLTAMHAHIWNGFGPPESYKHKSEVLNNWCNEVGRDPSEIERSLAMQPREVDQADEYLAAGATHMILGLGEPWDFDSVERLVKWRDAQNG